MEKQYNLSVKSVGIIEDIVNKRLKKIPCFVCENDQMTKVGANGEGEVMMELQCRQCKAKHVILVKGDMKRKFREAKNVVKNTLKDFADNKISIIGGIVNAPIED